MHGGKSPGAPAKNERAMKHGFRSKEVREWFSMARQSAMEAITAAESTTDDVLSVSKLARKLKADSERILSAILVLERRAADLEDAGRMSERALSAYYDRLGALERSLARVRSVHVALAARHPVHETEDDSEPWVMRVCLPDSTVVDIPPGESLIGRYPNQVPLAWVRVPGSAMADRETEKEAMARAADTPKKHYAEGEKWGPPFYKIGDPKPQSKPKGKADAEETEKE